MVNLSVMSLKKPAVLPFELVISQGIGWPWEGWGNSEVALTVARDSMGLKRVL